MKYFYRYTYTPIGGISKKIEEIGTYKTDAISDNMNEVRYWIKNQVFAKQGYNLEIIELYII